MTNIAMENHHLEYVNHLFLWAIYTMAMLNNQRVYPPSHTHPDPILKITPCLALIELHDAWPRRADMNGDLTIENMVIQWDMNRNLNMGILI